MWNETEAARDRSLAVLVAELVALATGVSAADIGRPTRGVAKAARARMVAMYLAHTGLDWPLWRVGRAFGRDRTTAGHAVQCVEDLRDRRDFDQGLERLEACLRALPAEGLPL